jgi:hypothetical protein
LDLRVSLEPEEQIKAPRPDLQPLLSSEGLPLWIAETPEQFWLWFPGLSLFLDFPESRGEARLAGWPYWQNVLRFIYFQIFLQKGGLLLHAAGVGRGEEAYVFPGPSGVGKTTIVRQSEGMAVLSDEVTAIQLAGSAGVLAHGTPFYGDWGQPGSNLAAPVKGLYFPTQAWEDRLVSLSARETLTRLLPCVFSYTTRRDLLERIFSLTVQLADRVPGFALHFRPGPRFWQIIDVF